MNINYFEQFENKLTADDEMQVTLQYFWSFL